MSYNGGTEPGFTAVVSLSIYRACLSVKTIEWVFSLVAVHTSCGRPPLDKNLRKIHLISHTFMRKHASWTPSFQFLAKSLQWSL